MRRYCLVRWVSEWLLFNAKLAIFQLYHDEAYWWFKSIFTVNILVYLLLILIICRKYIWVLYTQRRRGGSESERGKLPEGTWKWRMQALEKDWEAWKWGQAMEVDWKWSQLQERTGKLRDKLLKLTSKKKNKNKQKTPFCFKHTLLLLDLL